MDGDVAGVCYAGYKTGSDLFGVQNFEAEKRARLQWRCFGGEDLNENSGEESMLEKALHLLQIPLFRSQQAPA